MLVLDPTLESNSRVLLVRVLGGGEGRGVALGLVINLLGCLVGG